MEAAAVGVAALVQHPECRANPTLMRFDPAPIRSVGGERLPNPRVCSYNFKALLSPPVFQAIRMAESGTNSEMNSKFPPPDPMKKNTWKDWEAQDREEAVSTKAFQPLTAEQAQALRAQEPPLNPWRVIGVQAAVGVGGALLAALLFRSTAVGWSAFYGAACVVVPGALLARGMTSRLSRLSPTVSALSFLVWEMVKIAVSVLMLMLAPKLVQPLNWPALLAVMALCMKVYWFALLWRGKPNKTN